MTFTEAEQWSFTRGDVEGTEPVAAAEFPKVLFLFHGTKFDSLIKIMSSAAMKCQATLLNEGLIKVSGDTQLGGGYYVYTRTCVIGYAGTLACGPKGSGGGVNLIFSKTLLLRSDAWSHSTDMKGAPPKDVVWTSEDKRGQDRRKFTGVIKSLGPYTFNNEQGFYGSIALPFLKRVVLTDGKVKRSDVLHALGTYRAKIEQAAEATLESLFVSKPAGTKVVDLLK
jgi:hypothetical protein